MQTHYLKKNRKRLSALVLSVMCCVAIFAQLSGYQRTVIPTLSQLPVNTINCVYQDTEGYMWYGTVDGLCRDDGYGIHTFRNNFLTPELIQINLVQGITEDARHRIWFATHKGMYILDKSNYAIHLVDIPELREAHINNVLAASDGFVYAWSGKKLYQVNLDAQLARTYTLPGAINDLYEDHGHRLVASISPMGLSVRWPGSQQFRTVSNDVRAMSVTEDHTGKFLWLVAYDERIYKLRLEGKAVLEPQTIVGYKARGNRHFYRVQQAGANHYLWLYTSRGLQVLAPGPNGTLTNLSTEGWMPQTNMLLTCISKDRKGNVWVGGFDTPSFYVHDQQAGAISYVGPTLQAATHYAPAIVTLCRDEGGYVWYYQEGNGLYCYNPATATATSYRNSKSTASAPLHQVPYLIRSRHANSIWASTLSGAYLVERQGSAMTLKQAIDLTPQTQRTGNVESIYEDGKGNLWISTMRGLYVWKAATRRVKALSERIGDISDFVQTADGMVWATIRNRGIARIDGHDRIKVYEHNIDFTTVDATSDGHLWLGTGEGRVLEFAPNKADSLNDWTVRCGMNGDMVDHIAVDHLDHVWITTNQRVREFNPRNGAFRMLRTADEHVPLDRFLPRAVYFDQPTRTMYLGGIPGFIAVQPSGALERTPSDITVRISDVQVGGTSVWLNPERRKGADQIDIRPGETNITLAFTTLDYANRKNINYAYRLRGVDSNWIYLTGGHNVANYNKLGKGTYTLEVKATDENGLWSNRITRFTIHRLPAWYETVWAYTLYILLLLALVGVLARLYFNWHKEKQERAMVENLLKAKQMQIEEERREAESRLAAEPSTAEPSASGPHKSEVKMGVVRSFDEEFLAKATHIVEQNLANPELNVVFLASELGMSRSTFMRKIKAVTGQTPLDYIKTVKLKHAYAMLQDKTATIQDVMRAVGYNDRKTFTQSFKDAFNITPNEHQHKA